MSGPLSSHQSGSRFAAIHAWRLGRSAWCLLIIRIELPHWRSEPTVAGTVAFPTEEPNRRFDEGGDGVMRWTRHLTNAGLPRGTLGLLPHGQDGHTLQKRGKWSTQHGIGRR